MLTNNSEGTLKKIIKKMFYTKMFWMERLQFWKSTEVIWFLKEMDPKCGIETSTRRKVYLAIVIVR